MLYCSLPGNAKGRSPNDPAAASVQVALKLLATYKAIFRDWCAGTVRWNKRWAKRNGAFRPKAERPAVKSLDGVEIDLVFLVHQAADAATVFAHGAPDLIAFQSVGGDDFALLEQDIG